MTASPGASTTTKAARSPHRSTLNSTRPLDGSSASDVYVPTAEGWHYLASWLDLATREAIGYSMADHHRAELVVDALDMAAALGRLEPGCVIHSDRGSEYTSAQLRTKIVELGHRQSMGRTVSCFDNAAAESFWAVLKEEIGTRFWSDRPPPEPASSTSARPSTTDAVYASTSTGATSRPTKHACATGKIRPSRHNNTVSRISGKLQ
ncbi:DDE-type integrase/transposase/recombinase [Streptomyces acidicola]|uniref:DDE-type integrase/transposase/recombinase n=1 Tax=Streptomyces acidicola TaxID=2596892 RepID=UPI0037932D7F